MITPYVKSLTRVALAEYAAYAGHKETDDVLRARIRQYWEEIGKTFPGVETPWSGAFISWCVRTAGADASEFKVAVGHAAYVHWAIAQADAGTGLFQGVAFDAAPPALGDLVQWNRGGGTFDFAYARAHKSYNSHVAIVVSLGQDSHGAFALTVGGNESDSVGRTRVPLDAAGRIIQRAQSPFMCLIRTLK